MVKLKSYVLISICFCLFCSSNVFAQTIQYSNDDYMQSWMHTALMLQGKIDLQVPFSKASFIATHNTFNSSVYSQNGSYIDPNHILSIYDQLEVGVRCIELDVHYTFSSSGTWPWEWEFSEELKLCHAQGDVGCHPNDRYFRQGLDEIKNWLLSNPNEVLLIYIQDEMEGKYDLAISEIDSRIGNLVYKPNGCQSLPMDLKKSDVLVSGKQVILIGGNCATSNWANYVFSGTFSATESLENFTPYPTCTAGDRTIEYIESHLVRSFEDSTNLSEIFGDPGPPITANDAAEMVECNIGVIGLDQLDWWDSRLQSQIWSWSENEPNDSGGEDCAIQKIDGRFNDVSCENTYPVACQNISTGEWILTNDDFTWDEAKSACNDSFPGYEFAVPVNGYQNALLRDLKISESVNNVWINYTDQENEGDWVPVNSVF